MTDKSNTEMLLKFCSKYCLVRILWINYYEIVKRLQTICARIMEGNKKNWAPSSCSQCRQTAYNKDIYYFIIWLGKFILARCSQILTDISGRDTHQMRMKATDMVTITAAKAKVTPMISATRPFSAFCRASSGLAVAVALANFSSSIVGTEVVDLRSLSSGLEPNCKDESQLKL